MRIAFCTTADLTGTVILNAVLPLLAADEVVVFLSARKRATDEMVPSLRHAWFYERSFPMEILFPSLDAAYPDGGGDLLTPRQLARRYGVPMTRVATPEDWRGASGILAFRPDLVVSSRFGFKFPDALIEAAPGRVLNLHPSALPAYRGQFPVLRALAAGETAIGCTLHHVATGFDEGDIALVTSIPVAPGRSNFWHVLNAYRSGIPLIAEAVRMARAGEALPRRPQGPGAPPRGFPDENEIAAAAAAGWKLVDPAELDGLLARFRGSEAVPLPAAPPAAATGS
ncbi:formyltransferase family protein [Arenibaculum pallidiluteum]|uniref:formyltransferase family protein n=1 Tax=Arenibaculum pallidiluteum TaxID=2812559 RepID=UPI001A96AC03|nr:formyltransferase family protein [Arenibaculum pallidiluteum]